MTGFRSKRGAWWKSRCGAAVLGNDRAVSAAPRPDTVRHDVSGAHANQAGNPTVPTPAVDGTGFLLQRGYDVRAGPPRMSYTGRIKQAAYRLVSLASDWIAICSFLTEAITMLASTSLFKNRC